MKSYCHWNRFLPQTSSPLQATFPVHLFSSSVRTVNLTFIGIVGNTVLTSAAWFKGSKLTGMDLYDCCMVIVKIAGAIHSIPAAQALCSSRKNSSDV